MMHSVMYALKEGNQAESGRCEHRRQYQDENIRHRPLYSSAFSHPEHPERH